MICSEPVAETTGADDHDGVAARAQQPQALGGHSLPRVRAVAAHAHHAHALQQTILPLVPYASTKKNVSINVKAKLTRSISSSAMQMKPSTGSHREEFFSDLKMEIHCCKNVVPVTVIANRSFTCEVAIISATADVKPDETGPETKFMRNPRPRTPIISMTNPVQKVSNTAFSTTPPATCHVSSDAIAVGPAGTQRHPPKMM